MRVRRLQGQEPIIPPLAVVEYDEYQLDILLLISAYYSGFVPEEVRACMKSLPTSHEDMLSILREDKGEISREYIMHVAELNALKGRTGLAVTHHHLCPFGAVPCFTRFAPQLLETLFSKGFSVVMHGHVHLVEDLQPQRPVLSDTAYPIPCPSLTSYSVTQNNGFNIHLLGPNDNPRQMTSLVWQLSMASSFKASGLSPRYQFQLGRNIEVIHGARGLGLHPVVQ